MERIIDEIVGEEGGPLLIYLGGVHGNEFPGTVALENAFKEIKQQSRPFRGRAIALRGNLEAIKQGKRFIHKDLNRIWATDDSNQGAGSEEGEKTALKQIITDLLEKHRGKAYLFDLHTTSAHTIPFIVTRDLPEFTPFIHRFDVPFITGLTGLLDGTILSWFSGKGHCGLAFEAGQHQSSTSILKHHAFIYLSMMYTEFMDPKDQAEQARWMEILSEELKPSHRHFELIERYAIEQDEDFRMIPGYTNFQKIFQGEILATNKHGQIKANLDANIFMPLYQEQGEDGFFIIQAKS